LSSPAAFSVLGEGDGDDLVETRLTLADQVQQAIHEHRRLPRARGGLDREARPQL